MEKYSLSQMNVQRLYLEHPRHGTVPRSRGSLSTLVDSGDRVEVMFRFDPARNEELNQIFFGVDYEIVTDKPAASTKIVVNKDGTYQGNTDTPIRVLSLDRAVAAYGDHSVEILEELTDSTREAISYDSAVDRFVLTPDIRGNHVNIYRADCCYPRWIEPLYKEVKAGEGIRREEVPLEYVFIHVLALEDDGATRYLKIRGNLDYFTPARRSTCPPQPDNARRIIFRHPKLLKDVRLTPSESTEAAIA